MSYATVQDLKIRLGDRFNGIYGKDDATAESDIESAEAEVNATIGVRYITPVEEPTAIKLARSWTLTLTEELAYMRASGSSKNEKLEDRIKNVRNLLKQASEGKLKLGNNLVQSLPLCEPVFIATQTPECTQSKMSGF